MFDAFVADPWVMQHLRRIGELNDRDREGVLMEDYLLEHEARPVGEAGNVIDLDGRR